MKWHYFSNCQLLYFLCIKSVKNSDFYFERNKRISIEKALTFQRKYSPNILLFLIKESHFSVSGYYYSRLYEVNGGCDGLTTLLPFDEYFDSRFERKIY